MADDRVLVVYK